jgi:alginate biosynthesis protein AlgK
VPLARTLIGEGNRQALQQAEAMLLEADRAGDPLAVMPLLDLYSDHPEMDTKNRAPRLAERVAKIGAPQAEASVVKWYRRNALTNAKYEARLIDMCEPAKERLPDCYVDLARHYRAAGAGKKLTALHEAAEKDFRRGALAGEALERYAWSLVNDNYPGKPWPEAGYPMLKAAARTSTTAAVRMARVLMESPHLDPDARPEQMLLKAGEQGHPEAALALGRLYLDGKLVGGDPVKAERFLRQAAGTEPSAHYYLGRLYGRGYLGAPDPVRAAQHYLTAARSGYARGDSALAEMFSENRGVRPNLSNAFVFASLAAEGQVPESAALLQQIRSQMKPGQVEEGRRLLQQEVAVRRSLPRVPAPDTPQARAEASP